MLTTFLFLAICLLAYSNGANDNFKGVATLYGCNAASYRTAIVWGTFATLCGSVCSIFFAQSLLRAFSGKGLVPDHLVSSENLLIAVGIASALQSLRDALRISPDNVPLRMHLAQSLLGSGRAEEAEAAFEEVLSRDYDYRDTLKRLEKLQAGEDD